ncbi:MAG TPA: hypothetical protein VJ859_07045 [Allosphingosinicella sp.]|nr:hypothetical protein [Allosphingosinicella sp.]
MAASSILLLLFALLMTWLGLSELRTADRPPRMFALPVDIRGWVLRAQMKRRLAYAEFALALLFLILFVIKLVSE